MKKILIILVFLIICRNIYQPSLTLDIEKEAIILNSGIEQILEPENKPLEKTNAEYIYKEPVIRTYTTRITSYWENDDCNSEDMTASGKSSKDFQLNEKGWYTWNGKLVVATASTRLGRTNQRTYKLYQELTLIINGTSYQAIVLDVCGACMRDNRIDLFVKNKASMIDQRIEIIN